MAFGVDQFREEFTEFTSETDYPAAMINFWYGLAEAQLNVARWGDLLDYGYKLFVAHNIALAAQNSATGVVPGQVGLVTSESAGPLSYSKDTHSVTEMDGGHWNLTTYGTQFLRLARIVGTGGYQVY